MDKLRDMMASKPAVTVIAFVTIAVIAGAVSGAVAHARMMPGGRTSGGRV